MRLCAGLGNCNIRPGTFFFFFFLFRAIVYRVKHSAELSLGMNYLTASSLRPCAGNCYSYSHFLDPDTEP